MKKIILIAFLIATQLLIAQTDGSLDTTFQLPNISNVNYMSTTAVFPDGKILVGGDNVVRKVESNGLLDNTFLAQQGQGGLVYDFEILPDAKILMVGNFANYNSVNVKGFVRLNTDGTVDNTLTGTDNYGLIYDIQSQSDGKIILAGELQKYRGTNNIRSIVRVDENGDIDATFSSGAGVAVQQNSEGLYYIEKVLVQEDGKIIIGGNFSRYNTINIGADIARLHPDGTLDTSFQTGTGFLGKVIDMALQPDGKILVVGTFTSYNGTQINRLALLNPDGSLDESFQIGTGASDVVNGIVLQSDGKIIIGGNFNNYNGNNRNKIVRLNNDGSLDSDFSIGYGFNGEVLSLNLQPDGKVLVTGYFSGYNNAVRYRIARLNASGTLDSEDFGMNTFNIYPNPTQDKLNFTEYLTKVEIFSVDGKKVLESNTTNQIDVSYLVNGLYLIKVQSENGRTYDSKFLKN